MLQTDICSNCNTNYSLTPTVLVLKEQGYTLCFNDDCPKHQEAALFLQTCKGQMRGIIQAITFYNQAFTESELAQEFKKVLEDLSNHQAPKVVNYWVDQYFDQE